MDLRNVDLNLLVALDVLLDELSVSRAAQRLGVTQPAMSGALKRLRELLADPVLVRTEAGMRPTDKARRLAGLVREVLSSVQAIVDDQVEVDPARMERTVNIGLNDYASLVIIPGAVARLRREAPGLKLVMQPRKDIASARDDLENGVLDFVIGIGNARELPGSLKARRLFDDPFRTMLRRGHPVLAEGLSLARYLTLEHLLVSPQGHSQGIIDDLLAKEGLSRRVPVVVPHFAVAARLVAESDIVCTIPGRIAELFAAQLPIELVEPPLAIAPGNVTLAWHALHHENPVHRWVRERLVEGAAQP